MIKKLFLIILIIWPLGQLAFLPSFNLTTHWVILDLLNAVLLATVYFKDRKKIPQDPFLIYFAAFFLASLFSLIANLNLGTITILSSSLYLVRWVSTLGVYFAAKDLKKIPLKYFHWSLAAFLAFGLIQYILIPDVRFLKDFGFDDHYFRLVGTLLDPNFTGLILAAFSLFLIGRNKYIYSLVTLLALALTFSRTSYLSFLVGLIVLITLQKKLKLVLLLLSLALFVFLIPKPFGEGVNLLRTYSIFSRIETQTQAINLFLEKPLFGHGFNTLKFRSDPEYPVRASGVDNSFLFVLATTGALGGVAFALLLFKIGQALSHYPNYFSIYVSLLVHSLFNNTLFYLWVLVPLWIVLAYCSERKVNTK